jgi:hypothetical protein
LCAAICEARISGFVQQVFRRQFNSDPPSPKTLEAGIGSFRQWGAFVKEKVQDGSVCQNKAWNE